MVKKIIIGSLLAVGLGTFVVGKEYRSYLRTGVHSVRQAVKAEVPIEFEVARARQMVEQLVPDIRRCMQIIAEQQVDVDHLERAIAQKSEGLEKQKTAIMTLKGDLKSGRAHFVYAGRHFDSADLHRDLTVRFERYKAAESSVAADEKILAARQQTLAANQEKLDTLMRSKQELEVRLEQLTARIQTVQAAEAASSLTIDDSNLSHARQLIADLNKQLDVKEKLLDQSGRFTGLIPVEQPAPAIQTNDVVNEIDAYFSPKPADASAVADAE